jgi:ribA/ribD-fused uncharacterized protein
MDEYLKYISTFHKDLVTSLSQKEKYIRCTNCENKKQFIVNDNKLIYNCGSDSGKCGDQFIITVPDYIHYEKMIKAFQQSMNGSFTYNEDIHDYSEYNLEELSKYLQLDDELKEYNELKQTIVKDSQKLTSLFVSSNQLKQYYDSLTTLNADIQKNNIRKKKILHELNNDQLITIEDKISLRKEYATIVSQEKNELFPIYESILQHENNHHLLLQPKDNYVEKINSLYLEKGTKKKEKKDKDESSDLIDIIIDHFKNNNGVMSEIEYNEIRGNYRTKWGGRLFSSLRFIPGDKITKPWKKTEQEKYGPIIEKVVKGSKEIRLTERWIEYLNIKEDLKISVGSKESKNKKEIKYFSGSKDNKWLSAFHKANPFEYKGYTYPTVEHAFHSQKIDPKDPKEKEYKEYLSNPDLKPNEAKMYGGKTSYKKNNFTFRDDWDEIKLKVMKEITEAYYSENPEMKQKLIDTKDAELLHMGFRIDPYWGFKKDGSGENNHGKILMELRGKYS